LATSGDLSLAVDRGGGIRSLLSREQPFVEASKRSRTPLRLRRSLLSREQPFVEAEQTCTTRTCPTRSLLSREQPFVEA